MEIILNNINEYEKELTIIAPWEMVKDDYNDIIKKYSKLPIKGFRPGKAPIGTIEQLFRNQINNDLLTSVSTRLCRKALQEKNIVSGSPVEITESNVKKDESLQFKATFIEMPQFELPDYDHLNLQSETVDGKLDEISLKLLEQTSITLHPSFVEKELEYSDADGEYPETERKNAENRVKLMLILKQIAHLNSIEVDERHIEDRIDALAIENEVTIDELKEFLIQNNALSRITDSLLAEMVLEYIIEVQK